MICIITVTLPIKDNKEFEDTKGVIRIRKSKKYIRQYIRYITLGMLWRT